MTHNSNLERCVCVCACVRVACVNRSVNVTLTRSLAFTSATMASGGVVQVAADKMSFLVARLEIADAIILR